MGVNPGTKSPLGAQIGTGLFVWGIGCLSDIYLPRALPAGRNLSQVNPPTIANSDSGPFVFEYGWDIPAHVLTLTKWLVRRK